MKLLKSDKKGFTLVEVIISAVILGIVIISLSNIFVLSKIGSAKAKHRMKAMNLLRAKMEEIKERPYYDIEALVGSDEIESDVDNDIGTDELLNDTRTTSVSKDANNNLEVIVTIVWDEKRWLGSGQQSEDLVTLISPFN